MKPVDITHHYSPFGSGLPRESGLHLTGVIRSLQVKLGLLKTAPGWEMNVCADIGFLWEDALGLAYRDKRIGEHRPDGVVGDIIRLPPFQIDGIWMSPDGLGPDPETGRVVDHEYKCTWRSSLRDPTDDFYWSHQFKCYCHGMGVRTTILHVMYLMGDYRGSGPLHRVYRIPWSDKEIGASWEMILREREVMESEKG